MDSTHPWSFSKSLSGLESRHSFNNKNMKTEEHQRPWWNWMEPSSEVLELLEEISLDGLEMYKLLTVTTLKLESFELDPKNCPKNRQVASQPFRCLWHEKSDSPVAVLAKLVLLYPESWVLVQKQSKESRESNEIPEKSNSKSLIRKLHSFNFFLSRILNPQVLNLILVEHGEHVHRLGCQAGCRAAATAKETNSS